ncbi:unnamed protein product [Plutella xylostella]|uniref:(diamondback moth) hypothetical protein n=1 Tax=Plutella xylostella TaxID=51655 RepID=A0A8S4FDF0_PLUXY|nr:unnamed protein product [Plutella xylostella]
MSFIKWISTECGLEASSVTGDHANNFLDTINFCALQQFNNVQNEFNRILDLVLCNDQVVVHKCNAPLVPEDPHHKAICVSLSFVELEPLPSLKRRTFCYNRGDYDKICKDICDVDWFLILNNGTYEECITSFYNIIYDIRNKYVPLSNQTVGKYPPWYNRSLIKSLNEKFKYHKKYKKYGNLSDKFTFSFLRDKVKRLEKLCYDRYISVIEDSIESNPKSFWTFIKRKRKGTSFPSCMTYSNISSTSGEQMSDLFSNYFQSTFRQCDQQSNCTHASNFLNQSNAVSDVSSVEISSSEIERLLKSLDLNKSAGPDDLPAIFLSRCSKALSIPLSLLFKRSLAEGVVPVIWKSAFISPIHKKGPKNLVENYRPISKLCLIAKVFERIVYNQVYSALKSTFNEQQHGFLRQRSTVSNLLLFNDFISDKMNNNNQVDAVYTDYSKAFDRIDHRMLLNKLLQSGIRGDLYRWFSSYISNRSQAVVLNGYMSHWTCIPSGVPQGSLLGPLLFIIYINDIGTCFRYCKYLLFADDIKIFRVVNSSIDSSLLQDDLNRVISYCILNKLDINVSKCFSVSFGRKQNLTNVSYSIYTETITSCNKIRDLGVVMDTKLIFGHHIESVVNKAYRALGFLIRSCKHFKRMKSIKMLYCALVRSHLEYASQVWNPRYEIYKLKLESIQKKFIRYLCFKFKIPRISYEFHCNQYHLLPLYIRRDASDIAFLLKLCQNLIDCPDLLNKINILVPQRQIRRKFACAVGSYKLPSKLISFKSIPPV